MTVDPAHSAVRPDEEQTLRPGAIGFLDALVIGLASTSPAYSLAAILGALVALVGVNAPGVLLASFVPMLLIASAFAALNRVDPDCGTTFSWVTRALGPWFGWIGGWAIMMTGVLIVGSLADVGIRFGLYGFGELLGSSSLIEAGDNAWIRMPAAIALVLLMTWICVLGTDVSARLQNILILVQVVSLLVFAAVTLGGLTRGRRHRDRHAEGGGVEGVGAAGQDEDQEQRGQRPARQPHKPGTLKV